MKLLRKCLNCNKYTLFEKCPCGGATKLAHPPRFSIEDKWAKYRRKFKFAAI